MRPDGQIERNLDRARALVRPPAEARRGLSQFRRGPMKLPAAMTGRKNDA
jgi:hypothetical protein